MNVFYDILWKYRKVYENIMIKDHIILGWGCEETECLKLAPE